MKAYLILSCDGRVDGNFTFCSGVKNIILDCDKIKNLKNYSELINYLDVNTKLFNGSCFNNNIITNTIYKIYELGFINEEKYNRIIHFFQWHKRCGLCLKLEPWR